jgi:hypothetical protein
MDKTVLTESTTNIKIIIRIIRIAAEKDGPMLRCEVSQSSYKASENVLIVEIKDRTGRCVEIRES